MSDDGSGEDLGGTEGVEGAAATDVDDASDSEGTSSSEVTSTSEPTADSTDRPETEPDDGDGRGATDWTPPWLVELRTDDHRRHAALVAAALVGLGAAMVHWLGLFVAGALVGVVSRTLPRAVAAGLAVGLLALVVHVGASPAMGPGEFLALSPASYLSVGAALLFPLWGSLVRGVL